MKTNCPKCGFNFTTKRKAVSRCRSKLFEDYIFTLNGGVLRAVHKYSKCDLQLKCGKMASDYFFILNFYTKTTKGEKWLVDNFDTVTINSFWNDIEWLYSVINAINNQ